MTSLEMRPQEALASSNVPSLSELNSMLDGVRSMQSALASSTEHMNKALKKMMKTGQWRKEWNRASGKESLPKSEQHVVQVDLVTKIQAVRQEMASVRPSILCQILCRLLFYFFGD